MDEEFDAPQEKKDDKIKIAVVSVALAIPLFFIGIYFVILMGGITNTGSYGVIAGIAIVLLIALIAFLKRNEHWVIASVFWGLLLAILIGLVASTYMFGIAPELEIINQNAQKTNLLVLGSTSQEIINILNDNRDIIKYDLKTTQDIDRNPTEQISNYDIVMLDQSEQTSKEVTKKLGEAIRNFVKNGGSFIVVKDSGTRRPDTVDVTGWKNTFGDIIPVECDRTLNNQITCTNRILVQGKLLKQAEEHPIMKGVDQYPLKENSKATFETFDVALNGKEIAYIQSSGIDKKSFVGIAEKNLVIGKSIYFNYNPGKTRGIFEATLDYLG